MTDLVHLLLGALGGAAGTYALVQLDLRRLDDRRAARCARGGHRPTWDGYAATCARCGATATAHRTQEPTHRDLGA